MALPELPELPEAHVHRVTWDRDGSIGWQQYHDERDPLPDTWDDRPPDVTEGFFSGDQMRSYGQAVAEWAAKICEERAGSVSMFANSKDASQHNHAVRGCASAIRSQVKGE